MQTWKRTLAIIFVAQLSTSMGFSIIFPFLPLYVKQLGSSTGLSTDMLSGLVFSSQAFTMMLASPLWGALADRYGRKPMVVRAMLGGALTTLLMGFVRSSEELVALRALQGLLSGVVSASMALVASKVPREKTGYAMGVLQLAMWLGVSLGPFAGGVLSDRFGFRVPFVLTGSILCCAGFCVLFGVHEDFARHTQRKRGAKGVFGDWKNIVATPALSVALLLRFMNSFCRTGFLPIVPLFVAQFGGTAGAEGTFTGTVIGVSSAASTFSAVYLGRLGDRIGHHRIVVLSALLSGLFFIPQAFAATFWQFLTLQVITGFCFGGLTPSLTAILARNSRATDVGSVYGIDNSIVAAGRAAAPILAASLALSVGYRGVFVATGLIYLLMSILSAASKSVAGGDTRPALSQPVVTE